jgi:hypothetical protein
MQAMHLQRRIAKFLNLELKPQLKQLLGFLPLAFQRLAKYPKVDYVIMQHKIKSVTNFHFLRAVCVFAWTNLT